jgi:hypothetical protein
MKKITGIWMELVAFSFVDITVLESSVVKIVLNQKARRETCDKK